MAGTAAVVLVALAVTVEVAQVPFVGSNHAPSPLTAVVLCAKISEVFIPLCTKYDLSLGIERKGKKLPAVSTMSSLSFLTSLSDCN